MLAIDTIVFDCRTLSVDDTLYDEADLMSRSAACCCHQLPFVLNLSRFRVRCARSMDKITVIDYHQVVHHKGIKFWAYNAGHVLGAAMFMIEIAGVKVRCVAGCSAWLSESRLFSAGALYW